MPDLTQMSKAQLNAIADEIHWSYKDSVLPPSAQRLVEVVDTELAIRMYIERAKDNNRWPDA